MVWFRPIPAVTTSTVGIGNSRPTENCVYETAEKLLTILKSSIRSALLRRSSRDHNPSLLSLFLYGNFFRITEHPGPMQDSFQQNFVFIYMRTSGCWAVF